MCVAISWAKKLISILMQAWLVFEWTVTFINIYLDHMIYPDVGILETSVLAYAGPILVPGGLSLHIK